MYKLTIETESLDELYSLISNIRGKAEVVISESDTPVVKKERKKKDSPTLVEPQKEETDISYTDVSKVTLELVRARGKPAVLEILGQFKVKSAQELKQEQWKDYVALAQLHLKELVA